MYEVVDKNRRILFASKEDADNYNDYLKNGLKVIRTQGRTYYFNNGDRLIDTSYHHLGIHSKCGKYLILLK